MAIDFIMKHMLYEKALQCLFFTHQRQDYLPTLSDHQNSYV